MQTRSLLAISLFALAIGASTSGYADEDKVKEKTREVGHAVGAAAHEVGQEAKKAAKKVGHATKDAARETGHAFRDGAKEFNKAVKDEGEKDKGKK